MYRFDKKQEISIQELGRKIMGIDLKFGELCNNLKLSIPAGTNEKNKLLRDLSNILSIIQIPYGKQNKYRIVNIYDVPLLPYYDNDEWYSAFKSIICKMLKDNNNRDMWFTRTPLLNKTGMINDNFNIISNSDNRKELELIYGRTFDIDYQACVAVGNILSDRVYDALRKMEKERIIKFTDGYAIKAWLGNQKFFIIANSLENGDNAELYKLLFQTDNTIIDSIRPNKSTNKSFTNRVAIKQIYFNEFIKARNKYANTEEFYDQIKQLVCDFDWIECIYDIKFIICDDRLVEQEIRNLQESKKIMNLSAQKKIENSKNKALDNYRAFLPGIIKNYISMETEINYREDLDSYYKE